MCGRDAVRLRTQRLERPALLGETPHPLTQHHVVLRSEGLRHKGTDGALFCVLEHGEGGNRPRACRKRRRRRQRTSVLSPSRIFFSLVMPSCGHQGKLAVSRAALGAQEGGAEVFGTSYRRARASGALQPTIAPCQSAPPA